MPKKFTLLLSCLMLAVLAGSVSAGWWEGQTNWTAAVSNNWHDPCNWDNGVPDMLHWACVQGQVGDCNINAPAVTSRLSVACWPSGQPFMTLTISPNATLVDAGFALDIAAFTDGTYGVINMYGGKVINSDPTANATSGGLIIGGGDTGLRDVYGTMNMYAGEVNVPRISIPYGTLNLYGGLMDDRSTGASFTLGTRGKINVAGGTLKIKGDRTAPTGVLMVYINDGRVCGYDGRGDLSVTRDVPNNYTIVTAEPNYGRAWSPSPVNRSVDISFTPTLTWKPGEWVAYGAPNNGHHIYFGTDQNAVNNATVAIPLGVYVGRQDANSYSPAGPLGVGTTYYWRVDEANDANTPGLWKGQVWQFQTLGGIARDPKPESGTIGLNITPLTLSWTKGLWAATTQGHDLFMGTDQNEIINYNYGDPDPNSVYKGRLDVNSYPLNNLPYNTTYYWRVDEVNNAHPLKRWRGDVWSFTIPDYYVIDSFEYSDVNFLQAAWHVDSIDYFCSLYGPGGLVSWAPGVMIFDYDNNGTDVGNDFFSEARFEYGGTGADWTGGGKLQQQTKALQVNFQGAAQNASDPIYDRMYVALEDTSGHFALVTHTDPNAQISGNWQAWDISLGDFSSVGVDVQHVKYLYIGLGLRCYDGYSGPTGGEGTVRLDNIRLYPSRCVPQYGPDADFTDDCNVNLPDLDAMVRDWLDSDRTVVYSPITAPATPLLWYQFEQTSGTTVTDSAGSFDGTIGNLATETWEPTGGFDGNGCINFQYGRNTYVEIPTASLDFVATTPKFSISVWVNGNPERTPDGSWPEPVCAWTGSIEAIAMYCPTPVPPVYEYGPGIHWGVNTFEVSVDNMHLSDFSGRWNHFVVSRDNDAGTQTIYLNGELLAQGTGVSSMFVPPVSRFFLGTRDRYWGFWAGRLDDFRIYNYALTQPEAAYLATNGTGSIFLPLGSPTNMYSSSPQIIDFKDFSVLAEQWLDQQLWP